MNLARFPRRQYTQGITPIQQLTRLSDMLGGPSIYIKRDDTLGLVGGGNKTRKLEFLVADALAKNADTLITCGGVQSNHCRLTLAAANQENLRCRLVLGEQTPGSFEQDRSGNAFLYRLLGVEQVVTIPSSRSYDEALVRVAEEVRSEGKIPYIIPLGGSTPVGATGYVSCVMEIVQQTLEMGLNINYVVCASASAGTHAGLLVGFCGTHSQVSVVGINVMQRQKEQVCAVTSWRKLPPRMLVSRRRSRSARCNASKSISELDTPSRPRKWRTQSGCWRARKAYCSILSIREAMAGLIDLVRRGFFKKDDKVLFVHTGGIPGLYSNPDILLQ